MGGISPLTNYARLGQKVHKGCFHTNHFTTNTVPINKVLKSYSPKGASTKNFRHTQQILVVKGVGGLSESVGKENL